MEMMGCWSQPGLKASLHLLVLLLQSLLLLAVKIVIVMRVHTPYDSQQFCKFCSLHGATLCIRKNASIYIVSGGVANKTCSLIVFPVITYFPENFLCVTLLV